jgi:hypothetical protein
MSNVKRIRIEGELPFNCTDDEAMRSKLGTLNGPSIGLRLTWSPRPESLRPNGNGGRTAYYRFFILGEEAVSWEWLRELRATIERLGELFTWLAQDIESGERQ